MSPLLPFLVLDQICDQVLPWAEENLTRAGFRTVRTFNLQVARLAHPEYPCPNHGTNDCNCQMVILLVYGQHEDPATLIIHGQEGRSWVSLVSTGGKHASQYLNASIRRTLIPPLAPIASSIEATYEVRLAV